MSDEYRKEFHLTVRNKAAILGLAAATVVLGGALFVVGLTLIAGLVAVGVVVGGGAVLARKITGRPLVPGITRTRGLDPGMEVFPSAQDRARPRIRGRTDGER